MHPSAKPKLTSALLEQHVKDIVGTAHEHGMHEANEKFRKVVASSDLRTWEASVLAAKVQAELKQHKESRG